MAKKLFHNRVKASMCPVYEDISDDEFDPTEIQIVEKPKSYLGAIFRASALKLQEDFLASYPTSNIPRAGANENVMTNMIEVAYKETKKCGNGEVNKHNITFGVNMGDNVAVKREPVDSAYKISEGEASLVDGFKVKKETIDESASSQEKSTIHTIDYIVSIEKEPDNFNTTIKEISEKFSEISENAAKQAPMKSSGEKLLMEWSDISDEEGQEERSEISSKQSENESSPPKEEKRYYLKVSDKIFQTSPKIDPEPFNFNKDFTTSPPPTIPFFYLEQKELLAKPWKIETTPKKTSPNRASSVNYSNLEHFNCPHCTRKYWKESKLREHLKIQHVDNMQKVSIADSNEKRFEISRCPECKKQLKTKTDMYVHRLTHIIPDFKMMKCPLCGINQHAYHTLKEHVKTVHKLQEKWFCPVCPDARTFTQNHSLLIHISTFHFDSAKEAPSQYPCMQCNKPFGSKALLGRHVNSTHLVPSVKHSNYNMFKCEVCGKSFEKCPQLKKHIKARHMNTPALGMNIYGAKQDFPSKLKMLKKSLLNNLWSSKIAANL